MIYTFWVAGEPVAKSRPRASVVKGHAKLYTPKKTANYEAKVALAFAQQFEDATPSTKPLSVSIDCCFPLNKSDFRRNGEPNTRGQNKLWGFIRHTKKPDCDNIAKSILDGLNGIAFIDDSQITRLSVAKRYGQKVGAFVSIEELGEDE